MSHTVRYLSRQQVESLGMTMGEIIEVLEEAFRLKGEGKTEMPPKPGIHPRPNSFIHAMPASIPELGAAGVKWVSGFPSNQERGLPYITGLLILNDPETGFPMAIMDASWITAMRTAAATAVAARYLARPDSRTAAILGCGVQGRTNLEALRIVLKELALVKAYDTAFGALSRYVEEMSQKHGIRVEPAASPWEAVAGADVIVTAGPILEHPRPVIQNRWVAPGAFGCSLDYDSYWRADAIQGVDRLFTDDVAQLKDSKARGAAFLAVPDTIIDLSDVVVGKEPGRRSPEERILTINMGLALEDIPTAVRLLKRAEAKAIGTMLPL